MADTRRFLFFQAERPIVAPGPNSLARVLGEAAGTQSPGTGGFGAGEGLLVRSLSNLRAHLTLVQKEQKQVLVSKDGGAWEGWSC